MAVIKEVHDSAHESAHTGQEHTLASLRSRFHWPSLRHDVTNYVSLLTAVLKYLAVVRSCRWVTATGTTLMVKCGDAEVTIS